MNIIKCNILSNAFLIPTVIEKDREGEKAMILF
jgi:hypothetical protein